MSIQDEYKDLEERLRQSKPQTEPLPPAFKRQVRHELLEQRTMNDNRFSFRKLSMALGGLILLIGIPVFFWLAQMSIGATNNPDAALNPGEGVDPARPTPTVAAGVLEGAGEAPVVDEAVDRAWFVSSEPVEGETAGLHDVINVTVGYELVTVEEAELQVKLVDGPVGLLTAGKIVSGTSGLVTIPLSLAELEDGGEGSPLQLQLLLRDLTPGVEKLLYLEFVEGWTMAAAEQSMATAEIVQISEPGAVEAEGLPPHSTYEVKLVTTYTLAGYEDAVLVVGYEFNDENGSAGGYEVNAISAGSGTVPVTMWLDSSYLNDAGEVVDGVHFFARINRYDEALGQWVNLFPGNEPLSESELALPYPYLQDSLFIERTAWTTDELGQPVLHVTIRYKLVSQPSAEIVVDVTSAEGTAELASETAALETGEGTLTLALPLSQSLTEKQLLQVSAVMMLDKVVIEDEQAAVFQSQETQLQNGGDIWIAASEVVTHTTANGVAADITLVIGYNLSSEYESGEVSYSSQYQITASSGGSNGGGAGGGGAGEIAPGIGTMEFAFSFEAASWATVKEWLDSMSTSLRLFGNTTAGDKVLVAEMTKIGIE